MSLIGGAAMAGALLFWAPLTLLQNTANYATTFVAQYVGAGRHRPLAARDLLISFQRVDEALRLGAVLGRGPGADANPQRAAAIGGIADYAVLERLRLRSDDAGGLA